MSLLNFWKPKPPLPIREKVWVETRLQWLGKRFGMDRIAKSRVIVPAELDGDEPFDGSPEAARRLFGRICGFMGIDPTPITLEFAPAETLTDRAGEYHAELKLIRVAESLLETPDNLAATFAHELAHYLLFTQFSYNLLENDGDVEWVTDLTPTIFGLGIFAANATITDKSETTGSWHSWHISRQGYLPTRMIAYAMALQVWLGRQTDVRWIKWMRGDASGILLKSFEYLDATNDSLLNRDNLHKRETSVSIQQQIEILKSGTNSKRIAALWEISQRGEEAAPAVPILAEMLSDSQAAVRAEAARTLAAISPLSEAALPQLLHATDDWMPEVAATATYAIGRLHTQSEIVIEKMLEQLDNPDVAETVVWTLSQYGQAADAALQKLEEALVSAFARNARSIDYLAHAIRSIASNPEEEMERVIALCDEELQPQARNLIPEHDSELPLPPGGCDWRFWLGGPT